VTTADLTGAATSPARPARGWRRLLSFGDGGTRDPAAERLADLHSREVARARALREHAERLASVSPLAERLRRLAERAEAAARRLREFGAAPASAPTPAEPAATHWACLRRHAEEAADLAERYLDAVGEVEREQPALAETLTALRSACLADRETLVWLLATWDPVVLERLVAATAGSQPSASTNPAIASTRSPATATSGT
jgi:hypothetical protein